MYQGFTVEFEVIDHADFCMYLLFQLYALKPRFVSVGAMVVIMVCKSLQGRTHTKVCATKVCAERHR